MQAFDLAPQFEAIFPRQADAHENDVRRGLIDFGQSLRPGNGFIDR
jgi:hypothetical protein